MKDYFNAKRSTVILISIMLLISSMFLGISCKADAKDTRDHTGDYHQYI